VDVVPFDPALASASGSGAGQAVARNQDGTLNSPLSPAAPGEFLRFYFTGAGIDPACPYGGVSPDASSDFSVQTPYGIYPAHPIAGFVCGLYDVGLRLPEDAETQPAAPFQIQIVLHLIGDPEADLSPPSPTLTFAVQRPTP
jgi:uncharacterized protein (TIGR03437 family)